MVVIHEALMDQKANSGQGVFDDFVNQVLSTSSVGSIVLNGIDASSGSDIVLQSVGAPSVGSISSGSGLAVNQVLGTSSENHSQGAFNIVIRSGVTLTLESLSYADSSSHVKISVTLETGACIEIDNSLVALPVSEEITKTDNGYINHTDHNLEISLLGN